MRATASASLRRRRAIGRGAIVAAIAALLAIAPSAGADTCANAEVRAQQQSTLPECRAYELVNPPGLDYGDVNRVPQVSDDGEHVAYMTLGAPDGAIGAALASTFAAHRTASGWLSADANLVNPRDITNTMQFNPQVFSTDWSKLLVSTNVPHAAGDTDPGTDVYRLAVGSGEADWITPGLTLPDPTGSTPLVVSASPDLQRIVFLMQNEPLVTGAPGQGIYVSEGGGLTLISTLPGGEAPELPYPAGFGFEQGLYGARSDGSFVAHGGRHGTSDDATRTYFYAGAGGEGPLYLSDDGTTIPVSDSRRAGDLGTVHDASFIAAARDGANAYFASSAQLTAPAPIGGGIYRFDLADQSLTLLTPGSGDPAGLQLIGAIASDDQSHIYFTSPAALKGGAVAGETNAYVWSASEGTRFIAAFAPGDRFARVSPDGRFALILSGASIDGATNDGKQALYRYDYATESLACASCRPDGTPSQGDANLEAQSFGFPSPVYSAPRNLTDDGRVVFASTDPLLPADQGNTSDVYLYADGELSLISSGVDQANSYVADNSDDGRDIFFLTDAPLLPTDGDPHELDLYDARIGGGFLAPPLPPDPCQGEGCRTDPPPLPPAPTPATENFHGPGNAKPRCRAGKVRRHGRCVKRRHRAKRHLKADRGPRR